jgi:TPR repeat protein
VGGLLGIIAHTQDGGATWQGQSFENSNNSTIYAMRAVSPQVVVASGNLGHIVATIDGGETWFPTYGPELETLKVIARYLQERKLAAPVQRREDGAALRHLRHQAERGSAGAQYNLGLTYYTGERVAQNYSEAAKWYRKSADQGHIDAQYNLGIMYANATCAHSG